jgi:hypothetical protein
MFRYSFKWAQNIESCMDCDLTDDGGSCVLLYHGPSRGYKEQFEHCPLTKEEIPEVLPFVSYAPDELKEELGTDFWCQKCSKMHEIVCGKVVKADGTKEESKALQYVQCDDGKLFLVGLHGKAINRGGK